MWTQCLDWISTAYTAVLGWVNQLIPSDFIVPFFTAVGIFFAGKYLIAPLVGSAGSSDRAKKHDED